MTVKDYLETYVCDDYNSNIIIFDNPSYDTAFVGLTANEEEPRAVYSFRLMIEYLMETEGMDYDDAAEYVEYNSIGAHVAENGPIVIYDFDPEEIANEQ